MIRKITYLFTLLTASVFGQTDIASSSLFTQGNNSNFPFVFTSCSLNDGNSGEGQVLQINITDLPVGSTYRVYKTTASGGDFISNPQSLTLGFNELNVTAVSFARTVKFQFSSGLIEFDYLSNNGEILYDDSSGGGDTGQEDCIGTSDLFTVGANANFPYVFAACSMNDDNYNCNETQTLTVNIISLPESGANYRKGKTTMNGQWNFGSGIALNLGINVMTIAGVSFDRSVRFQFSSPEICYNSFSLNGTELLGINDFNNQSVVIYPNPATNIVTIDGIKNIRSIRIYSVLGSLEKEAFNHNRIDVSDLSTGVHLIKIDNGEIYSKKIVKQ